PRPARHAHLADPIEIQLVAARKRGEDLRTLPADAGKLLLQVSSLRVEIGEGNSLGRRIGDHQEEHRAVLAHAEPADGLTRNGMTDVTVFVAWPIAGYRERGDGIAQELLELCLGPEHQPSHRRVQPIGADQQVEAPSPTLFEVHEDTVAVVMD